MRGEVYRGSGCWFCLVSRRVCRIEAERGGNVTQTYRIAVIGGDGIGPEVTAAALAVVRAAGVAVEETSFDLGAARFLRDGFVLDDATLETLRGFDAIMLGAVGPAIGDTRIPGGTLERGLLLKMRFGLDLYVNYRPFRGVAGSLAEGCEFAIVRENTEGPYAGEGGFLRRGTPHEIATQGSVNSRFGVERCVRYAFQRAERSAAPKVTLVHKTNVLTFAGDLWSRVVNEVAGEFPGVDVDYQHVDAACIYLVEDPRRYNVIVTDNLFGDILSDLAGAVSGGIGYAASANLNPDRTGASLFEPVHGAAHDIVGRNMANPLAAVSSAVLMLEHLGEEDAARRVSHAVRDFDGDPVALGTSGILENLLERL
ncbi:MAG: 3-isopropylmalate dehydrogenase [Acidobacteria bacterium]|nr:3-isopropylmalate dehydrogenase [Acidobacteriota bacterium]